MRIARSAGVAPKVAEVQRGKIRRKVEVKEKPKSEATTVAMDFSSTPDFTTTSTFVRGLSTGNPAHTSYVARTARGIQRIDLENGTEYRIPITVLEDTGFFARNGHLSANELPFEQVVGRISQCYRREVEFDQRTREYVLTDTLTPGIGINVEVAYEVMEDICESLSLSVRQLPSDVAQLRRIPWHEFIAVPRGMVLRWCERNVMNRTYRMAFEAPEPHHLTVRRAFTTY